MTLKKPFIDLLREVFVSSAFAKAS